MRKVVSLFSVFLYGLSNATPPQDDVKRALSQLKDIHMPAPVSWWPLAFGWSILVVVGVLILALLIFVLKRQYARGRPKRRALKLLNAQEKACQDLQASPQFHAAQVSELLKRVALVYFSRNEVAGLQGDDWICFLNKTSKGIDFHAVRNQLLEQPYQPNIQMDLQPLFPIVREWIKQRRKPCSS